jgi:hypothetical protein
MPVRAILTSIGESTPHRTPSTHRLYHNYPNPFNPETVIRYELARPDHITLKICNAVGQEIKILKNARQEAGTYAVRWTGIDSNGKKVPSGIYFYSLQSEAFFRVGKMILLR